MTSAVATVVGIAVALFGASGVFGQLQDALNTIWGVKPKPGRSFVSFLRARFLSFAMVAGGCFLLLVSLTASLTAASPRPRRTLRPLACKASPRSLRVY